MDLMNLLQLLGWAAVGLVMILFALTGGFDFGAGMLLPFVARTDNERRVVINTVGPTWDGNQVWLITAGGAIFAIWPRVYAASFSGFYFAFLLVLWALFLRPVAFEYRSKMPSITWRKFWDWGLFFGSLLPALLIGVAIGNLFLGFPFQYDPVSLRFFYGLHMVDTNALLDLIGLLRPFGLFVGVFCVVMMILHGSSYLTMRVSGPVLDRVIKIQRHSARLLFLLFILGGVWLYFIPGYQVVFNSHALIEPLNNQVSQISSGWLLNYKHYPWMGIVPLVGLIALWRLVGFNRSGAWVASFISSCVALFCIIATMGLSLYPFIMPSMTHPSQSLIIYNSSSSEISLIGILIVAVVMLPIIFFYTGFVYKKLWGRGERLSGEIIQSESKTLY